MNLRVFQYLLLFLLLAAITHANITINEIMYDPVQNEHYNQWIELLNPSNSTVNIENWTLCNVALLKGYINRSGILHLNTTFEISANGFALVTDGGTGTEVYQNFNVSENSTAFHTDASSICGGLTKTNKTITLRNSTSAVIDNITYQPIASEGRALCRANETFYNCNPTPGYVNALLNETNETENNATNATCDLSLEITTGKLIFENETIKYNIIVNDSICNNAEHEINITYWAEDLFGNIIKNYDDTAPDIKCFDNISRSWTPGDIFGSEGYLLKANITSPGCNETNHGNNVYSKPVIFKGLEYPSQSSIKIIDINSGDTAKYGESVDVKVEIYKNITSRYAVYAWIEDAGTKISEQTKIHIKSDNTLYNFTIPIQLKHNCNGAYKNGIHTVVIEGLGLNATGNISISGVSSSVCRIEQASCSSGSSSSSSLSYSSNCSCPIKSPDYEILSYEDVIEIGKEFDTEIKLSSKSYKNISIYSYVYSGNNIISLGFDGNKWSGAWTANKHEIELSSGSVKLILKNKIENGTAPGLYNLRVRIIDGTKYDMDREIRVVGKEENVAKNGTINKNDVNETVASITSTQNKEQHITALISGKSANNYIINPDPTRTAIYMFWIKHFFKP